LTGARGGYRARAVRTLVISDLHLGNRAGNDVLRRRAALAALLDAFSDIDRLVLLGDLAELMTRHPRRPLAAAESVVRAIGARLGPDREVVLVPGNHDAPLIRSWALAQGRGLSLDASVPADATRALDLFVSWLAPAQVRVRYPGVWLSERVFATHGHYLDHHLFPESAFGTLRLGSGGRPLAPALASDYEWTRRRVRASQRSFLERLVERPFPTLLESSAHVIRNTAVPAVPRLLLNARLAPVTASVLDLQMQRASVPAMDRVVKRLGVQADWVVFGHVHRTGPLAGDSLARWSGSASVDGSPRYLNTGSWMYEPLLVDRSSPPHPYWPGGAVLLEPGRDPVAFGLLDGLGADQLRDPRH
jgi:UDP-2,3-diacylglucosamine pyrophosphatase LpxH